jgi:predicted nucleic acid-binding protein
MTTAWLDTNVVVRFLTQEPAPLARRAERLLAKAQAGEIALRLTPIVAAEIVWVLTTIYGRDPAEVASAISALLSADGILADQQDTLLAALDLMRDQRVAFPDAFIAVAARQANEPVCTFDADFKRLGVELLSI